MNRSVVEFFSSYPTFFKLNYATGKLHPAIITGFVIIIGVIQLLVHSLQNIHTVYNFIYSFADFLITLVILLNLSAFLYNNKQVRQLMSHIDQHIYVYSDESKIMPSYEWIEQDDNMVRVFLYICGYFFFLGGAVSLAPFIQFLLNEKIEIIIYPGWTPWSTDRTVPFLCTYLIHFNFVVVCCFAFNLDCIFPLFITLEFRRQRKRLCAALLSIENRAEDSIRRNEKKSTSCSHESHAESIRRQKRNYQRMLKANIVECVKHHQMLLKYGLLRNGNSVYHNRTSNHFLICRTFKLFQPWWRMMFSVQLAASIANVTLSVFAFMEVSSDKTTVNVYTIMVYLQSR